MRYEPIGEIEIEIVVIDTQDQCHSSVEELLAEKNQRYTNHRKSLVRILIELAKPASLNEILEVASQQSINLPISTAYRNLAILEDCGVVRRLIASEDLGLYELAEALTGNHHHHLICEQCGDVNDLSSNSNLERALSRAAEMVMDQIDFQVTGHRIDLTGICSNCNKVDSK